MWAAVGDIRFETFSTYMMESLMKVKLHMALDMAFVCKATNSSVFRQPQVLHPLPKEMICKLSKVAIL